MKIFATSEDAMNLVAFLNGEIQPLCWSADTEAGEVEVWHTDSAGRIVLDGDHAPHPVKLRGQVELRRASAEQLMVYRRVYLRGQLDGERRQPRATQHSLETQLLYERGYREGARARVYVSLNTHCLGEIGAGARLSPHTAKVFLNDKQQHGVVEADAEAGYVITMSLGPTGASPMPERRHGTVRIEW
jgi:hypothetical protein